jgi:hypothetical protein
MSSKVRRTNLTSGKAACGISSGAAAAVASRNKAITSLPFFFFFFLYQFFDLRLGLWWSLHALYLKSGGPFPLLPGTPSPLRP